MAVVVLLCAAAPAHASFHLFAFSEAYSSADGKIQFVELRALTGGQEFLTGHTITASSGGQSHVFTFPTNLPGDTAGRTVLIGTASFAALGIVTPDYVVADGFLFTGGGLLDWAGGFDDWAYGALPTDGVHSLNRDGTTGINSPTNFAGVTGQVLLGDLAVTQSASPSPVGSGKDVVYTLTVMNAGGSGATGVVLTDTVPGNAAYIWSSPACTVGSGTVTCNVGALAAGATASYQVVLRPATAGTLTNMVSATMAQGDGNAANNTSSLDVPITSTPAGVPVQRYRLYNPISLEHLYTTDLNEYTVLGAGGVWQQEGTVGSVLNNPGTFNGVAGTPYYRLYSNISLWHHWTTDPNEYYTLLTFPGWGGEGVDGYLLPSATAGTTALFRLVYPNGTGLHHWTIDNNEYTTLIGTYGWVGEGGTGFVVFP
jgi:uncharacterized repeat protein (TIGR01451 family)